MSETKPYNVSSLAQLLDGPTSIDWILDQFIPPGTSSVLAGDSSVGKTWLALDLALAIALGEKWLGQFATRQGKVLIVDEENAELLLRVRLKMLLAARGLSGSDIPVFFMVGNGVNLSPVRDKSGESKHTDNFRRLFATIKELQPALVIFDSLTRVHRSRENDSAEMAQVFKEVKTLVDQTGTSCIFTHHFRKGSAGGSRSGQRIRGSSDIRAFVDCSILVDPSENGIIVTHDKSRWSTLTQAFEAEFVSDDDTFSIRYTGEAQDATGSKKKFKEAWLAVVDALSLNGGSSSRQDLIQAVVNGHEVCSVRTLDQVLSWRCAHEFLRKESTGRQVAFVLVNGGRGSGVTVPTGETIDVMEMAGIHDDA